MRPISSCLDQTSLVNKGFIIWKKNTVFSGGLIKSWALGKLTTCEEDFANLV